MLTIISPAKTLDYDTPTPIRDYSIPSFLNNSQQLIDVLHSMTAEEIGLMMKISPQLAELNADRFRQWQQPFTPNNAKQALFAFKGDVYTSLDAGSLTAQEITFAQNRLRILSGLYGLLRPLDLMQPYRLEMGTRLANPRGRNLYEFWRDSITEALNTELAGQGNNTLVNLASHEYFKAIRPTKLEARVITPVFKEFKDDNYKVIGLFAKRARGMMARFMIREGLDNPDGLKDFSESGYLFNSDLSTDNDWVFTRKSG